MGQCDRRGGSPLLNVPRLFPLILDMSRWRPERDVDSCQRLVLDRLLNMLFKKKMKRRSRETQIRRVLIVILSSSFFPPNEHIIFIDLDAVWILFPLLDTCHLFYLLFPTFSRHLLHTHTLFLYLCNPVILIVVRYGCCMALASTFSLLSSFTLYTIHYFFSYDIVILIVGKTAPLLRKSRSHRG